MTSFGAQVDDAINTGSGPYVFRVAGQICHWIGTLCPPPNEKPRFLQMYIYDTEHEISNRLNSFKHSTHPNLDEQIVQLLLTFLESSNELVKLFRSARDLCHTTTIPDFSIRLYHSSRHIRYDSPTPGTIGAIVYESAPDANDFDIIIHSKDGPPKRVSKLHPLYMALQYPLLFLFGESGWSPELRLTSDKNNRERNLTANMFYSYMIHDRAATYSVLLRSGRLFQQYLVDAYVCVEQFRLEHIRSHQNLFRVEFLQGIHDAISKGETEGQAVGKRIFLPSSFTGGPRYMYKHYQDALAICRVHGNPQYFITFTCNVKWPEITRFLQSFHPLKAQDRPDIIARIFHIKVIELLDFLRTERPFGRVVADLYTVEFQKRGLPHYHMLLWVAEPFRIHHPEDIDKYISAEIPDPTLDPHLYKIITDSMMHGPCGLVKKNAPCMVDGCCSKNFPKKYEPKTRFDKNGYAHYKRTSNGLSVNKNGIILDNAYVVPYNRSLCLRFQAHINVEYCGWNMVIKYLFKYISKGADRIRFTLTKTPTPQSENTTHSSTNIDEITNFIDGRFICPHEASWRLLDFELHHRNPPVQLLAVHLENMQSIRFTYSQQLQDVIDNPVSKRTTLTEWLHNNKEDPRGRHLRYIDYLQEYTWDVPSKLWKRRTTNHTPPIGRLIYIHPSCGETFYLRMLLSHQTGCTSFNDIKTVRGFVMSTFREACEKLGLLEDDNEWSNAFTEASAWATASELRSLFAHMLLHCEISNPLNFWSQHWHKMSDDIIQRVRIFPPNSDINIDTMYIKQYVLYEIESLLNSHATPSSLADFGLPTPQEHLLASLRNKLLMEKKNYDKEKLAAEHARQIVSLQGRQLEVYETVIDSIEHERQILLFVYGHGGTGKTFLWTTIINALRSQGKIVLAVAASGIASLLLPSGRTAHSRFKLPFDTTEDKNCQITKNTQLARLLIETSLIIWDEAPMNDRKCFESLDRSLKDILDNNSLFGGKSVLLGGDFRQTLPVKRKASKSQILAASLPMSYIWEHFKVVRLTENMRLRQTSTSTTNVSEVAEFATWLLQIGDGELGIPDETDPEDTRITKMSIQRISTLKPECNTNPLDIRVVRKWTPFRSRELYFLFVDKHGDAIEASTDAKSKQYYENTIKVGRCYTIKGYICCHAKSTFKAVDNQTFIMFGKASTITPIQNEAIPKYYFNFVPYSALQERKEEGNKVLTDFIGRVIDIKDVPNRSKHKLLQIKLQHESGKIITVSLWEEIAQQFDHEAFRQSSEPVILAVAATKVINFSGLQLSSTAGTVTYINPQIPDLDSLIKKFKSMPKTSPPSPPRHNDIAMKKIIPLSEAVYNLSQANTKRTFTCLAYIKDIEINNTQNWYYIACTKCISRVHLAGKTYMCLEDGPIESPTYRYRFTAKIADDSCTTTAVFFNDVVASMINMSCHDMVTIKHTSDQTQLPPQLQALKQIPFIFELQQRNDSNGPSITVVNVFQPPSNNKESLTSTTSHLLPSTAPPSTPLGKSPKRNRESDEDEFLSKKNSKKTKHHKVH